MSHRLRAKDRLGRHTFGWEEWTRRGPAPRLHAREEEKEASLALLEPRVPQRDQHGSRALRAAEAGPNAPLLKRLVRYPYALHPVRPAKREGRPADVRSGRDARPTRETTVMHEAREAWVDPVASSREDSVERLAEDHRPGWRPHPFRKVRARRGRSACE